MTQAATGLQNPFRRAQLAVYAMFFINGTFFTNWASRIPQRQEALGLDERGLGLALLGLSVGVVLMLPLAGGFIGRFGSRAVTVSAAVLNAAALPLLALAGNFWMMTGALFLFGGATSLMDMAMNAQGVAVEKGLHRPVMSSFHAAWSLGGFAGALLGGRMAAWGVVPLTHFLGVSLLFGALALLAGSLLMVVAGEQVSDAPPFVLPPRPLWLLGVLALCAAMSEGAMADWSAVYMRRVLEVNEAAAAWGLTAFTAMMTVGRFAGDWMVSRFDRTPIVRLGGVLATSGLLLLIVVHVPLVAVMGFGLVGLGLATVVPIAFSAGGSVPGIPPGTGIAGVATIGYAGFLAGPPLIGLIAEGVSLPVAMGLVAVLTTGVILLAGTLRQAAPVMVRDGV